MEYLGLDWPRGLAQQYSGGEHFNSEPSGGEAQQAAGLALLATGAGALAAGAAAHREVGVAVTGRLRRLSTALSATGLAPAPP